MPRPINVPIVTSTAFAFDDTAACVRAIQGDGHIYSRWANPTVEAVGEEVARLVGAERSLAFGSGMAAISSALLCALGRATAPRLLCHRDVYGGSYEVARDLLPKLGFEVRFFPTDGWEEAFEGEWGVVYAESPTNPTLRVLDLEALSAAARRVGATLIVDNTFATPIGQRPLELGADVELHSASKYMAGHHDLLAGVVAGGEAFCADLWKTRKLLGGCLDPMPAYLLLRGLKTLEVRFARQSASALELARWLEAQPWVARVVHPGLASHPDHAVAARQLRLGGAMLSFAPVGGDEAAVRLSDALERIQLAASLGGVDTTLCLPHVTSHVNLSADEREAGGIVPGLARLSVGVEPWESLRDDLAGAAARAGLA
jgi:cystathionine gamma-synthase